MTGSINRDEYDALLRMDLTAFTERVFATVCPGHTYDSNWHVEAMTEELRKVQAGLTRRLLITMPPRYLKSIAAAVAFPAWVMGRDPTKRFLVASYGGVLATKHAGHFRMVMESDWYGRLFPRTVASPRRDVELEFETADGGFRRAVSLGGAITGLGADILLIDDLMKAAEAASAVERQRIKDFYEQTLFSRLDDKRTGAIIAIQQRLHEDDLAAYLMEKNEFTHLNLRAIAEEDEQFDLGGGRTMRRSKGQALFEAREPLDLLAEMRTSMGPAVFEAQYQQNPTAPEGNLVRWSKIQTYDEAPERERFRYMVQSWDVAVTATPQSDFSVCTTWGFFEKSWLLLDLYRIRFEYPELLAAGRAHRRLWKPDVILIEKAGAGRPFFDDMHRDQVRATPERDDPPWRAIGWQPKTDKVCRMAGQTERLENGLIRFPSAAPFLAELKAEMKAFPNSRYDDQVDSVCQFADWVARGRFQRALDAEDQPRRHLRTIVDAGPYERTAFGFRPELTWP
jgi:predicted phage terminase large subunit-like protein